MILINPNNTQMIYVGRRFAETCVSAGAVCSGSCYFTEQAKPYKSHSHPIAVVTRTSELC